MNADPNAQKFERQRRRRNIAIALTLAAMVVAFYLATFVRFGTPAVTGS